MIEEELKLLTEQLAGINLSLIELTAALRDGQQVTGGLGGAGSQPAAPPLPPRRRRSATAEATHRGESAPSAPPAAPTAAAGARPTVDDVRNVLRECSPERIDELLAGYSANGKLSGVPTDRYAELILNAQAPIVDDGGLGDPLLG